MTDRHIIHKNWLSFALLNNLVSSQGNDDSPSSTEVDAGGVIWSGEAIDAVKRAGGEWTPGKKIWGSWWRER